MKTFLISFLSTILTYSPIYAESNKEQIEAKLFTVRTATEFEAATQEALNANIHPQVITEATFLYYVDTENYKAIASIHEKFQENLDKFDINHSKIFTSKEQWLSVIEYSLALKSLHNKQEDLFKKHITEAFWLSPETASAFSHHITSLRNKKAIAKINIAAEREMLTLTNKKVITFKDIIKNNDALVLRFWSPWNQQIDTTYPYILNAAQQCSENKIAFASVLTGNDQALIESALDILTSEKPALTSQWLIDSTSNPFAKQLRISNLPTMVIITKDGKVTYHGSASNKSFWENLSTINPQIKHPNIKDR